MTMLDRPVWHSLATRHAALGTGNDFARRYDGAVSPFASACDDSDSAAEALAALLAPGEQAYILQRAPITVPGSLSLLKEAIGVQMVYDGPALKIGEDTDIRPLRDTAAPQMQALAHLTEPGPFRQRTHEMGSFCGIFIDDRLAAMAGERMRFPGFTEVSGVCSHPDFRGRGLARRLSRHVTADILTHGDTPFLHAWKTNMPAIALYQSLGFRHRCDVHVAVLERPAP